jgi:hypothetical protein
MDHDRLGDLFFLLGMTTLAAGCGGVVPLEDDAEGTDTTGGGDTTGGPTSGSSTMTAGPSTMTTSPSTTVTATETTAGDTTSDSTGIEFTDSATTTGASTLDDTTAGRTTTTTTMITGVIDETTTTAGMDLTTTGYGFTSGIFTGGFTSSGTGGPSVYEECAGWAYQYVYCYIPAYPGLESFFRYYCNTSIIPGYDAYSMACGYAALEHFDCLSTLDCTEWPNLGMGSDCDATLSSMEMMCGL